MLKEMEDRGMVARPRSQSHVRDKSIEVTRAGLATLCRTLPIANNMQQRLFVDEGSPGGNTIAPPFTSKDML